MSDPCDCMSPTCPVCSAAIESSVPMYVGDSGEEVDDTYNWCAECGPVSPGTAMYAFRGEVVCELCVEAMD